MHERERELAEMREGEIGVDFVLDTIVQTLKNPTDLAINSSYLLRICLRFVVQIKPLI